VTPAQLRHDAWRRPPHQSRQIVGRRKSVVRNALKAGGRSRCRSARWAKTRREQLQQVSDECRTAAHAAHHFNMRAAIARSSNPIVLEFRMMLPASVVQAAGRKQGRSAHRARFPAQGRPMQAAGRWRYAPRTRPACGRPPRAAGNGAVACRRHTALCARGRLWPIRRWRPS
jgi:hypothetical protein